MSLAWLLAIVFTAGWIPLYLSRAEALGQALVAYTSAEKVATVTTAILLSLHMAAGCVLVTLCPALPVPRALLALAVYVAGIGFWFWGRTLIGPLSVRRMPDEPPLAFRRDGAFGIVRHPLYFGCLVATAAPVVATVNPWLAGSYGLCAAMLAARAVQEEKRLRAQLGAQYETYCNEVKRLVPFVW